VVRCCAFSLGALVEVEFLTITIDLSGLKRTKWYEFAIRFVTGGVTTALIGVITKEFGPKVGGLFLAFPSIFPAAVTLVESHEKKKKSRIGLKGETRGREAAGLDAAGAAVGSVGLLAFAVVVWRGFPGHSPGAVLASATLVWLGVSGLLWWVRKRLHTRVHKRFRGRSFQ
jgi:Protein of unknown function (DUF3147)